MAPAPAWLREDLGLLQGLMDAAIQKSEASDKSKLQPGQGPPAKSAMTTADLDSALDKFKSQTSAANELACAPKG